MLNMEPIKFLKFTANIVVKDWTAHGKFLLKMAAAMAAAVLLVTRFGPGQELAWGILVAVGVVSPYVFAHLCFFIERQHGLLHSLIVRPITPAQVVLAKYASAFSMALFVMNAPSIFLADFSFVGYLNIGVLLLTSICMAVAVVSRQPWAPLAPVLIALFPYLYARPLLMNSFRWIGAHRMGVSIT